MSIIILIFKKGDKVSGNYRGIDFLNTTFKIITKALNFELLEYTTFEEEQYEFGNDRSTNQPTMQYLLSTK